MNRWNGKKLVYFVMFMFTVGPFQADACWLLFLGFYLMIYGDFPTADMIALGTGITLHYPIIMHSSISMRTLNWNEDLEAENLCYYSMITFASALNSRLGDIQAVWLKACLQSYWLHYCLGKPKMRTGSTFFEPQLSKEENRVLPRRRVLLYTFVFARSLDCNELRLFH